METTNLNEVKVKPIADNRYDITYHIDYKELLKAYYEMETRYRKLKSNICVKCLRKNSK